MGRTATELRNDIEQRRYDLTQDFEVLGDRVSPSRVVERRTEAVKGSLRSARERVMGTADDVGDSARTRAHDARDSLHDTAASAGEAVGHVPDAVRERTQGNPLAAGLVAFGLGLLAGTVLPSSRREQELGRRIQPRLEDAAEAVGSVAGDVVDDLRPAVQRSVDELTSSAKDAGTHLADEAKDAVGSVGGDAKEAAGHVKDAAT